jgi:hypothetical protein
MLEDVNDLAAAGEGEYRTFSKDLFPLKKSVLLADSLERLRCTKPCGHYSKVLTELGLGKPSDTSSNNGSSNRSALIIDPSLKLKENPPEKWGQARLHRGRGCV